MSKLDPLSTPNRPQTPPNTMWFEFLLDKTLLETHLAKTNPDPTPGDLITLFLYQADVAAATAREIKEGQGIDVDAEPPDTFAENKKIKALKLLALKVASFLKWDLQLLDKGVPVAMVQDILLELLKITLGPDLSDPQKHKSLDFKPVSGEGLFAIQLYHRWCLKTAVATSFPVKSSKAPNVQVPRLLDPNAATASAKETVLQIVREGIEDSSLVLSSISELGHGISMPTVESIGGFYGEEETDNDWSKCEPVSEEELLCQVCFDLGSVYFFQQKYREAYALFTKAKELFPGLKESRFCQIAEAKLSGYYSACSGILGKASTKPSAPLIERIEVSRKNNFANIDKLLREDNGKLELSLAYRIALEHELKKVDGGSQVYYATVVCNGIRRVIDSRLLPMDFVNLMKSSHDMIPFFLDVSKETTAKCSFTQKANLKHLVKYLCHALPAGSKFLTLLTAHSLSTMLFSNDELKKLPYLSEFQDTTQKLNSKLPSSTSDDDKATQQHKIERQLLTSYEAGQLKDLVSKLSNKMRKDQLKNLETLSDKWHIPRELQHCVDNMPIPWVRLYAYILLAKSRICVQLKLFERAKDLLKVADVTTKEISFKLARILPWEILRLDLLQYNTYRNFIGDQTSNDLKKRARSCLSALEGRKGGSKHEVRPHEEVVINCVAFLINIKDWESLCQMYNSRNGFMEFGRLLGALCKQLPHVNNSRKAARELWEAIVLIFTNSSQQKRTAGGNTNMIHREANQGPVTRKQLIEIVEKINEPLAMSVLLSLLTKLYATLKDDISTEISSDYIMFWPTAIGNPGSLSTEAISDAVTLIIDRALDICPGQQSWLRTKADICFAHNQHSQALKYYLEMGVLATDYFYDPINKNIYDDQIFTRMIKCCLSLHAHSQAAVLCQCLDEVDYSTAFKAFQERTTQDAMDTYYQYIWDTTILEYLINLHQKRGENDKCQIAIKTIGQLELNSSNPPEILFEAARIRKSRFLRAMARQYV